MKTIFLILTGLAVMVAGTSVAQERAAAGALDTQMTWSTLSNQVKTAQSYAEGVNSRVDQLVACAEQGMLYAPKAKDANAQGCLKIVAVGKDCNFAKDGICTNDVNCMVRYYNRKADKIVTYGVPDIWKHDEIYVWKNNSDNFVGAQCRNGKFTYFGTGL